MANFIELNGVWYYVSFVTRDKQTVLKFVAVTLYDVRSFYGICCSDLLVQRVLDIDRENEH